MSVAVVFPGQGSHRAGVLDAWSEHAAFAIVDEITDGVGRDIRVLARDETAGSRTADAQPAIMAESLVVWRALADAGVEPSYVAGHSLGEYTAAVAAGVLPVHDGAAVVAARGAAMAEACAHNPGTMAAIVKLDPDVVEGLVADADGLVVANDNAPGQVVVAGRPEAVEAVGPLVREAGGRLMPLDVEGAFHSPAMEPAVAAVRSALVGVVPAAPHPKLVTGVSGDVLADGEAVCAHLIAGILAPVRWRAVQHRLVELGVTDLVEAGPGGVLAGLARRAMPDVRVHKVEKPADLATVLSALDAPDPSEV